MSANQPLRVRRGEAHSGPLPVSGGKSLFRIMLDEESVGARRFALLVNEFGPGLTSTPHKHDREEHAFYILSGSGMITIEGEEIAVEEGDAVFVP
ncbi:MAG: cupin domain-containing protein, partial [bacterium]